MIRFLLLITITLPLGALTLDAYVRMALTQSDEAFDIRDAHTLSVMEVRSEENVFDWQLSPDSSFGAQEGSTAYTLGVSGSRKNRFGGEVYGGVDGSYREGLGSAYRFGSGATVGYRQSLWRKFGEEYNTLGLFLAQGNAEIVQQQRIDRQENLLIEAVGRYYSVTLNRQMIGIRELSLKRSRGYFEAADAKARSGLISKVDLYRAKINFLEQKKQLGTIRRAFENAREEALYLINEEQLASPFDDPIRPFSLAGFAFDEAALIDRYPQWVQMEQRIAMLQRRRANARSDLAPDLTLDLSYRRSGNAPHAEALQWERSDWAVTVGSSYAFNRFSEKQQIQRLDLQAASLRRDRNSLRRDIFKTLRTLRISYEQLSEASEIELLKQEQAKAARDVAKVRFNRGLSGNLDLIDAENAYLLAQINYLSALISHNLAALELLKAYRLLSADVLEKVLP